MHRPIPSRVSFLFKLGELPPIDARLTTFVTLMLNGNLCVKTLCDVPQFLGTRSSMLHAPNSCSFAIFARLLGLSCTEDRAALNFFVDNFYNVRIDCSYRRHDVEPLPATEHVRQMCPEIAFE